MNAPYSATMLEKMLTKTTCSYPMLWCCIAGRPSMSLAKCLSDWSLSLVWDLTQSTTDHSWVIKSQTESISLLPFLYLEGKCDTNLGRFAYSSCLLLHLMDGGRDDASFLPWFPFEWPACLKEPKPRSSATLASYLRSIGLFRLPFGLDIVI